MLPNDVPESKNSRKRRTFDMRILLSGSPLCFRRRLDSREHGRSLPGKMLRAHDVIFSDPVEKAWVSRALALAAGARCGLENQLESHLQLAAGVIGIDDTITGVGGNRIRSLRIGVIEDVEGFGAELQPSVFEA